MPDASRISTKSRQKISSSSMIRMRMNILSALHVPESKADAQALWRFSRPDTRAVEGQAVALLRPGGWPRRYSVSVVFDHRADFVAGEHAVERPAGDVENTRRARTFALGKFQTVGQVAFLTSS